MGLSTKDLGNEGGSGIAKTITPGNHRLKINSINLEDFQFIEGAKHLMLHVETEPIEGFTGFLIDKDDESKGNYAGQIGRLKASQYAYANGETKSGIKIQRDRSLMMFLAGKEYENKAGYTAYDLWLPKAENNKYAYGDLDSERILKYDETKHLKKIEVKEVKGFGDDDDFTKPTKGASDFSLD